MLRLYRNIKLSMLDWTSIPNNHILKCTKRILYYIIALRMNLLVFWFKLFITSFIGEA